MGRKRPTLEQNAGRVARRAAAIIRDRGHVVGQMQAGKRICALRAFQLALAPVRVSARKANEVTTPHLLSMIFCKWLETNYSAPHNRMSVDFIPSNTPQWNDYVLKEDTLQWLEKFADSVDPQ